MKRILVTYATMAGSTAEVAQVVAEEIAKNDVHVDVIPMSEVKAIQGYDGVVVGAPMIMGWHRAALSFLKQNRKAFKYVPFAIYVMAMSLIQTEETSIDLILCL
jgi:menaquinone-dependent protoporphyrinogen oxidase